LRAIATKIGSQETSAYCVANLPKPYLSVGPPGVEVADGFHSSILRPSRRTGRDWYRLIWSRLMNGLAVNSSVSLDYYFIFLLILSLWHFLTIIGRKIAKDVSRLG